MYWKTKSLIKINLADRIIRQIKINSKYCWLDLQKGFSETFEYSPVIEYILDHVGPDIKLIQFYCLNDPNFEFTKHMKLK